MIKTTNHTRGPWWRDDDGFLAAGHGDSYVTLASFNCTKDIDIDEREANLSLAISAPYLLELGSALKDIINASGNNQPYTSDELRELFAPMVSDLEERLDLEL